MAASEQPYQMSFTSGGMQLNACVDLAKIRLELGSWDQAARSAVSTGLTGLPKASSNERTVRELVKRLKTLSDRELEFLLHEAHRSDQIQLLWISICRAYRFVREFASEVVCERYLVYRYDLPLDAFDTFFAEKAEWDEGLEKISETTRKKLRQMLFRFMRDAEIISADNRILASPISSALQSLLAEQQGIVSVLPGAQFQARMQ